MSSASDAAAPHLDDDARTLHKLGYAQELFRSMDGFQNFAISFTIISILAGCLTSYYIAFESGGPIAVTWGWLIVGLFSTIIALRPQRGRSRVVVPARGWPPRRGVKAVQSGGGVAPRLVQSHRPGRGHG